MSNGKLGWSESQSHKVKAGRLRVFVGCLLAFAIAACSANTEPEVEASNDVTVAPAPEYSQRDGDLYMYVAERTEDDKTSGKFAPVVAYRYLGLAGTMHRLEMVGDGGSRLSLFECSNPCRVVKETNSYGAVSRLAVEPRMILAAAFRDVFNGYLMASTAKQNAIPQTQTAENLRRPSPVPSKSDSPSESDWRGKRGQCRLRVKGINYIGGACWIRLESDGSFQIMALSGEYFAQLSRSEDSAEGFWNETAGSTHAQTSLGVLKRSGACWNNTEAEICAWNDR